MSNHKHHHCQHPALKYCSHCNVVYCVDCDKEWFAEPQIIYRHYPYYTYDGVRWTLTSASSGAPAVADYQAAPLDLTPTVTCNHHGA